MTSDQIAEYYAKLLILQYREKEKAFETVKFLASLAIIDQLPLDVQSAFAIGSAIGVQLDVIGKYVGVTRYGNGFSMPITLDDEDFTQLIRIAILTNNAGSSLYTIQNLLNTFFEDQIFVFDYKNMHLSYFINSSVGSQDLVQLLVTQNLLPKPMAVQIASIIYAPNINSFFGFRTYDLPGVNNTPANTYDDYETDRPWLTYSYALEI